MASAAPATKKDVTEAVKAGIDDVLGVLNIMMTRMDERFLKLETEFAKQQEDIRQILIRLDHIDKRLEIDEQERLVMGHQLERLDKWVHELAGKIGYKLSV